ncbi:hypothetical protein FKM82_003888 [Ascaphus truei]
MSHTHTYRQRHHLHSHYPPVVKSDTSYTQCHQPPSPRGHTHYTLTRCHAVLTHTHTTHLMSCYTHCTPDAMSCRTHTHTHVRGAN